MQVALSLMTAAVLALLALPQHLCAAGAPMPTFRYGFRHDPMQYVREDTSLQAALVRRLVFRTPRDGDDAILQARIAEVLKGANPNGSFGNAPEGDVSATSGAVSELLDLGLPTSAPQIRSAVAWIAALPPPPEGKLDSRVYWVGPLCRAGDARLACVRAALKWLCDHPGEWIGKGCPWTPAMAMKELWDGREVVDVNAALTAGLTWVADNMNAAGCLSYWDPLGLTDLAGYVDHPLAKRILQQQVPMLLRWQESKGGWGENSLSVFRALHRWGLLEALAKLPALPPDWKTVRSLPVPDGAWWGMTFGDGLFWLRDSKTKEVVALSPKDGSVVRGLKLPEGKDCGIGWWQDGLALTQREPKRLLKLDPQTGEVEAQIDLSFAPSPQNTVQVGGKLWLSEGYLFPGWELDPTNPKPLAEGADPMSLPRLEPHLAGALGVHWAAMKDGVWMDDYWSRCLLKSAPDGKLLDWGDRPFGPATCGLTTDGESLWALNAAEMKLCSIVKAIPEPPADLGTSEVKATENSLTLPGVRSLGWGKSGDCTFAGGLEAALAVTRHPVSRRDIMGVSALAFRVRWYYWTQEPNWCSSTSVGEFPEERDNVSRATGWQLADVMLPGESAPEDMAAFAPDVIAYLKAGLPVVGYPDDWNCAVCFGYQKGGAEFLWYDYWSGDNPKVLPAAKPGGPWLLFLSGWQQPPSERDVLLNTLRLAVRNWTRRAGPEPSTTYWYGDSALIQWMDDLSLAPKWSEKVQSNLFFANWWNAETLLDARGCAASYLKAHAGALQGPAQEALMRAADLYQKEQELLRPSFEGGTIFLGPWTGKSVKDWTPEVRAREIEVLRQCRELEQQAVAEIEKALAAAG